MNLHEILLLNPLIRAEKRPDEMCSFMKINCQCKTQHLLLHDIFKMEKVNVPRESCPKGTIREERMI